MKRIMLHLTVFALLLPCMFVFTEGSLLVNFLGVVYVAFLYVASCKSAAARRFFRDYYREILRLERML